MSDFRVGYRAVGSALDHPRSAVPRTSCHLADRWFATLLAAGRQPLVAASGQIVVAADTMPSPCVGDGAPQPARTVSNVKVEPNAPGNVVLSLTLDLNCS